MRYIFLFVLSFAGTVPVIADAAMPTRAQADAAFDEHRYGEALDIYLRLRDHAVEALRSDGKRIDEWSDLSARVVRCNLGCGDDEQAVQEYFLLCQAIPMAKVPLDCLPLPWFLPADTKPGMRPHEKTAVDRLDPLKFRSPGLPATLLAATVLSVSSDSTRRAQGLSVLRNLENIHIDTRSSEMPPGETKDSESELRKNIALLASAFLWKQRIPMLKKLDDAAPLKRILEQLPGPLRYGPYYLYGQSCRRVGDLDTAVLTWMRLPVLYPDRQTLRLESLREAALCLDKLGRSDQAERLRQEAVSAP